MKTLEERRGCRLLRALLCLALMCLAAGCASPPERARLYEGQQLQPHEVAYLVSNTDSLRLHSVDGRKSPSGRKSCGSLAGKFELEVLPGEHTLNVFLHFRTTSDELSNRFSTYETHYEISSPDNVDIRLSVEPGHRYLLSSEWAFDSRQWFVVIKDTTKDQVVIREGPYPLKAFRVGDFFKSPGRKLR